MVQLWLGSDHTAWATDLTLFVFGVLGLLRVPSRAVCLRDLCWDRYCTYSMSRHLGILWGDATWVFIFMLADDTQLHLSFNSLSADDQVSSVSLVEFCVGEIDNWMTRNKVKLNRNKTELLVISSRYLPRPSLDSIVVRSFSLGQEHRSSFRSNVISRAMWTLFASLPCSIWELLLRFASSLTDGREHKDPCSRVCDLSIGQL